MRRGALDYAIRGEPPHYEPGARAIARARTVTGRARVARRRYSSWRRQITGPARVALHYRAGRRTNAARARLRAWRRGPALDYRGALLYAAR